MLEVIRRGNMKAFNVRAYQFAVAVIVAACTMACGQTNKVSIAGFMISDPIPQGYEVLKADNGVVDGKAVSKTFVVVKDGSPSTVVLSIDVASRVTRDERLEGAKGYVEGTTESLLKAGFKPLNIKQPYLDNADFDQAQVLDLVYAKADGTKLFVQLRFFFTHIGYNILVLGNDQASFTNLTQWASSIEAPK